MKYVFLSSLILMLQACSTCHYNSFYEPINTKEISYKHSIVLATVEMNIADKLDLGIGLCDDRKICISMFLKPGSTMKFNSDLISIFNLNDSRLKTSVHIDTIQYEIICIKGDCTSNEGTPIDGEVSIAEQYKEQTVTRTIYSFSGTERFRGEDDTLGQGAFFGNRMSGRRSYLIRELAFSLKASDSISLKLPSIELDGITYEIPPIQYLWVRKKLCRLIPFQ